MTYEYALDFRNLKIISPRRIEYFCESYWSTANRSQFSFLQINILPNIILSLTAPWLRAMVEPFENVAIITGL